MAKLLPGLFTSASVSSAPDLSKDTELLQISPYVLVVDNRTADTIILGHYLRQFGCRHRIAATCEAAAMHIQGHPPYDAILIDIATLGADKNGLLPLIRGREGIKQRTQIIAMSASAFDDPRNAEGLGFDGYLTKPCNPRLLAQKLGVRDLDSLER